jgi:hypothetical protein
MYTSSEHINRARTDMKASFVDLRKRSKEIVKALDRNQSVTLFYRGKAKGVILPASSPLQEAAPVLGHRAFGMWRGRAEFIRVPAVVAELRKPRHAL